MITTLLIAVSQLGQLVLANYIITVPDRMITHRAGSVTNFERENRAKIHIVTGARFVIFNQASSRAVTQNEFCLVLQSLMANERL